MKISVVTSTYNHAHYLPQCIESSLGQTLKPHEVIVVDIVGGSKDNTKDVVARYPVKYLHQRTKGVSDARNLGVETATGDWVAFLDSDDYWLPERLEKQAAAITDEAFAYCAATRFYQDGRTEPIEFVPMPEAQKVLRHHNFIDTSAGMVRRDAFLSVGGFNHRSCAGEEWELWLKLIGRYKANSIPDRLLMYRVTGAGLSMNPVSVLDSMEFIAEAATSQMPPLKRFIEKQRLLSVRTALAAIKFRDKQDYDNTLRYSLKALAHWPSPFWDKAFRVLMLELKRRATGGQHPVAPTASS